MSLSAPIETLTTELGFAELLAAQDGAAEHVETLLRTAWGSADTAPLLMCWIRMATLQQDQVAIDAGVRGALASGIDRAKIDALSDWPTHELFDEVDRASIAIAEQFVMDVNVVDEDDIAALKVAAGDAVTFNIIAALSVFDQCIRLRVMTTALLVEV